MDAATTQTRKMIPAQDTGGGAMSFSLSRADADIVVHSLELHLSSASATAEDLTVTRDDAGSSVYNTVLYSEDVNGLADIKQTNLGWIVKAGDSLVFTYANTDTRTFGLTVWYQTLPN